MEGGERERGRARVERREGGVWSRAERVRLALPTFSPLFPLSSLLLLTYPQRNATSCPLSTGSRN